MSIAGGWDRYPATLVGTPTGPDTDRLELAMTRMDAARPAGRATTLVLAALREAISTGEVGPGEQIRQQAWADRLGVSRPPLREALEILTNEGLLMHGLNKGYFVAKLNRDEMEQLYTMRRLLETEALLEISWPSEEKLAEFENIAEDVERHAGAGRPDIAMAEIAKLYLGIYELSTRKLVVEEVKRLWARTVAYRSLSFDITRDPARSAQRLHLIVDVLRARDLKRLRELLLRPTLRGQSGVTVGEGVSPGHPDENVAS